MKKLILLLTVCGLIGAQSYGATLPFKFYESFEGWVKHFGNPGASTNHAYEGNMSMNCGTDGGTLSRLLNTPLTALPKDEVQIEGTFVMTEAPTATRTLFRLFDSGVTARRGSVQMTSSRVVHLVHGSTGSGSSTGFTVELDTRYFVWWRHKKSTGASDGISEFYISTESTQPEAATFSITTGTDTNTVEKILLGGDDEWGCPNMYWDNIRVYAR